jgi:hypothetical protein
MDSTTKFLIFMVYYDFARAERFELPSTVLETAILPLNYARRIFGSPKGNAKVVTNGTRNKCDPEK